MGEYKDETRCCANCGRTTEDEDGLHCIPRAMPVSPTGGCDNLFMSVKQMEKEANAKLEKELTETVKEVSGFNASLSMEKVVKMTTLLGFLKIIRIMFDKWRAEGATILDPTKMDSEGYDNDRMSAGWNYNEIPTRLPEYSARGEFCLADVESILWVKSTPIRKLIESGDIVFVNNGDDRQERRVDITVILSLIDRKVRIRRTTESMKKAMSLYNVVSKHILEHPLDKWEEVYEAVKDDKDNPFNSPSAMWVALRLFEKLGGNAKVEWMRKIADRNKARRDRYKAQEASEEDPEGADDEQGNKDGGSHGLPGQVVDRG